MIKIKLMINENYTRKYLEQIYLKLLNNLDCSLYLFDMDLPDSIYKKILFNKNIDINKLHRVYELSFSILMWACLQGNYDKVNIILQHPKINTNLQNNNKETALMCCVINNNILCAKSLLQKPDIDVNLKDDFENTALGYAYGSPLMQKLIKNHPGYKGLK